MKVNDFKILIAEDEPGVQKLYEKAFKTEGYEVVLVESGSEILAELAEGSFDLLITDMNLANMSALEALPDIRKAHPIMPIVVVSGHYQNMEQDFHEKGFNVNCIFNKPLSLSVLLKAVRNILGIERAEDKTQGKSLFSI